MDKAVQYVESIDKFVQKLNADNPQTDYTWTWEKGRKFDKVFLKSADGQRLGSFMVDRNSWTIFGIKSWAQVNPRRVFGTLETVGDWEWKDGNIQPKAGTDAEKAHTERENAIKATYAQRGRPRKPSTSTDQTT